MNKNSVQEILTGIKLAYDQLAEQWSQTRHNLWPMFKDFLVYVKAGDSVLDLGCGNGRLVELFSSVNVDYIGLDVSKNLVDIASKKYPDKRFVVGDMLKLPFSDNSFDCVFAIASLHHIPSVKLRQQAVSEINRVLKPSGYIVMLNWYWHSKKIFGLFAKYTITKFFGLSKLDFGDIKIPFGRQKVSRYVHLFSLKSAAKILSVAGFKVLENRVSEPSPRGFKNVVTIGQK